MTTRVPVSAEKQAVKSSRWLFGIGIGTVFFVIYLSQSFSPWLFARATPTSTSIITVGSLAILLAASGVHLVGAYLLRHRLLLSVEPTSTSVLVNADSSVKAMLVGKVKTLPSSAEMVGTSGKAYVARINNAWYFVASDAARALELYARPET